MIIVESHDGSFPKVEGDVKFEFHFIIPQGLNFEPLRKDLFVDTYYLPHLIHQNIWLKKRTYYKKKPDEYSLRIPQDVNFSSWVEERDLDKIHSFLKRTERWVSFAKIPVERTHYMLDDVEFYVDHCKIGEFLYDVATSSKHVNIPKIKQTRNKIMQFIHVRWYKDDEERLLANLGQAFRKSTKMIQDPYIDNTSTKEDIQQWAKRRGIKSEIQTTGPTILCLPENESHLLSEANVKPQEIPLVMFWLKQEPGHRVMRLLSKDWNDITDNELSEMASWDPKSVSRFTPFSEQEMKVVEQNIHIENSKRIKGR